MPVSTQQYIDLKKHILRYWLLIILGIGVMNLLLMIRHCLELAGTYKEAENLPKIVAEVCFLLLIH